MRFIKLLAALAMFGAAMGASATPAAPQAGNEYVVLAAPQPTDTGKKVEVIEFFAYYCPHCYAWENRLQEWVKKHGGDIVFKRVHVSRDISVQPQQKLFFTLEALGQLDRLHGKVFEAIHVEHNRMSRDENVFDFIARNGIDKDKFTETYRGFGIHGRVRRTDAMMQSYQIDSWPMIAIDGKYLTSPYEASKNLPEPGSEAQQQANAEAVMDFLVARARAEKK